MAWTSSPEQPDPAKSLRRLLNSLVDSVVHSNMASESKIRLEAARKELESRLAKLDEMKRDIQQVLAKHAEGQDGVFSEVSSKLTEFSDALLEQAKERITAELQQSMKDMVSAMETEKSKVLKSLEAFFVEQPLPLLDRSVYVERVESGYGVTARYRCDPSIEYEFTLDAKASSLFKDGLLFSELAKGARVPVRLGKSWLKKDAVPDYEKLDQYVLTEAELSQGHLVASFEYEDKKSSFRFTYSKGEGHASASIEYKDELGAVDVTSDAALNNHLELAPIETALDRLAEEIAGMEKHKVRLAKLKLEETDVFTRLNCYELLIAASNSVGQLIREELESATSPYHSDLEAWILSQGLDTETIRDRLKQLGDKAPYVARALGLAGLIKIEPSAS